jgi:hypothetical protein
MLAGAVASGAAIGRARTPRAAVGALGLAAFAAAAARRLFRREGVATEAGIVSVVRESARRTAKGESRFTPSVVDSPRQLPAAAVTVLFRPWLGEARNPQMLAAAAEGSLLAYLTARRLGDIAAAPRRTRDEPFLAVALVYATLFVVAYSGIANFGALVRQRVQLLPLLAVLLVGRRRSNG